MTKKDFIQKISTMQYPDMKEFDCSSRDLPETCWLIFDKENLKNKFCTPAVRMSHAEYFSRKLETFYSREKKFREKYERWIKE